MDKSVEVRWISEENFPAIENWFKRQGKYFKNSWERSDFYLNIDGYPNLSFKIREDKAELKTLINHSVKFRFSKTCEGIIQHWIKWSKPLKESLKPQEIFENKNQMIELKKERLLITYSVTDNEISIVNERAEEGCQVELTRLGINEKLFFSFALEAFGSDDNLLNNLKTVSEFIFAQLDTILLFEHSFSYPTLLSRLNRFQ